MCVLEKGAEVGAHILSGNVFEPRALDELLPNWKRDGAPIEVPVSSDKFWFLTKNLAVPLPSPFDNKGNYEISLSQLVRWLAAEAEELGVEIYSGFAASVSIPNTVFPGGAIIGCSAGFLNVPKIKGTHTAMKSGMLAAEASFGVLHNQGDMNCYWDNLKKSWIWNELHKARNYRPAFEYGFVPGLAISALEHYVFSRRLPFTLNHGESDHKATVIASLHKPISYPKPDGKISFDVPTSLYRSNTNHEHDQPAYLHLKDTAVPEIINLPKYAGLESRYCPARVYEYAPDEKGNLKLEFHAQNCLHCKACDIKYPKQNIEWTVPEGGGGPGYTDM